jgi:ABC-type tungstate transport system substrate-binding protein
MKRLPVLLLSLLLLTGVARAESWLDQLDIPLMEGLAEDVQAGTVFETATGRVVVVEARGAVAAAAVEQYYGRVLPELGWHRVGTGRFLRESEELAIAVTDADGQTLVVFRLAPEG